jgi:hypothetical protein
MKHVIVLTDKPDNSQQMGAYALRLFGVEQTSYDLVHASRYPSRSVDMELSALRNNLRSGPVRKLARAAKALSALSDQPALPINSRAEFGRWSKVITRFLSEGNTACIVGRYRQILDYWIRPGRFITSSDELLAQPMLLLPDDFPRRIPRKLSLVTNKRTQHPATSLSLFHQWIDKFDSEVSVFDIGQAFRQDQVTAATPIPRWSGWFPPEIPRDLRVKLHQYLQAETVDAWIIPFSRQLSSTQLTTQFAWFRYIIERSNRPLLACPY